MRLWYVGLAIIAFILGYAYSQSSNRPVTCPETPPKASEIFLGLDEEWSQVSGNWYLSVAEYRRSAKIPSGYAYALMGSVGNAFFGSKDADLLIGIEPEQILVIICPRG